MPLGVICCCYAGLVERLMGLTELLSPANLQCSIRSSFIGLTWLSVLLRRCVRLRFGIMQSCSPATSSSLWACIREAVAYLRKSSVWGLWCWCTNHYPLLSGSTTLTVATTGGGREVASESWPLVFTLRVYGQTSRTVIHVISVQAFPSWFRGGHATLYHRRLPSGFNNIRTYSTFLLSFDYLIFILEQLMFQVLTCCHVYLNSRMVPRSVTYHRSAFLAVVFAVIS